MTRGRVGSCSPGRRTCCGCPRPRTAWPGARSASSCAASARGRWSGAREQFTDRLLSGDRFLGHTSTLIRKDYLERAVAGSYPPAFARTGRRRGQWLDNYLARIVERDAPDVSPLQRLGELPLFLRVLAARNSEELHRPRHRHPAAHPRSAGAAGDALPRAAHPGLVNEPHPARRLPAKAALLDAGLAARLLGVCAAGAAPAVQPEIAGHLLEGFVAGELRRQQGWAEELVRISHYRDHAGDEVDLILETDDGRVAGIEVQATSSVGRNDGKWLAKLRDRRGVPGAAPRCPNRFPQHRTGN